MTTTTDIEVLGIKAAIKELNTVAPELRKQITKDYKLLVAPMISDAKNRVPADPPLSGWARSWTSKSGYKLLPWSGDKGKKLIKAGVSGKQPKEFNGRISNLAVFFVRWQGAIDTIFDMAGKRNSSTMASNLASRYGNPSRVMYPAFEAHKHEIETGVEHIVDQVAAATGRNLQARTTE
jgi:hypothetical protein